MNIAIATIPIFLAIIYGGPALQAFTVLFWLSIIYHTIRRPAKPKPKPAPEPEEMSEERRKFIFGE